VLWDIATGKEVRRFQGHREPVTGAIFSPDGKRLLSSAGASGRADYNNIFLWDVETGKPVQAFLHGHRGVDWVLGLALAPDGKIVYSSGDDGVMRQWDVETGKEVKRVGGFLGNVMLSPNGRYLVRAGGGGGKDLSVRIWDTGSGKEIGSLKGLDKGAHALAFLPDSRRILSAEDDGTLRLWDILTGEEIRCFEKIHTGGAGLNSQGVSRDGRRFVSYGNARDRTMRLWDVETGKQLYCFEGHTAGLTGAIILPDGQFALSSSFDHTMRVWRLPGPPTARKQP
jgi:WD40 repeat protein